MKRAMLVARPPHAEGRKILVPPACHQEALGARRHHRLSLRPAEARRSDSTAHEHPVPGQHAWRCMRDGVYTHGCGLDVHTKPVGACLRTSAEGSEPVKETRTFRTMTAALLALADWLQQAGGPHVAMESPGVYGRPVYKVLAGQGALLV